MTPILKFGSCAVALGVAAFLTGCATVTRGTKDVLVVESVPAGATVTVDGQTGTTPTSFKLSRKFEGTVVIAKDGYETLNVQVSSSPSTAGGAGMAGNVILGGLIGAGVDAGFGSTNDLHPNPISVTLVPLGGAPAAPAATAAQSAPEEPAAAAPSPAEASAVETATAG